MVFFFFPVFIKPKRIHQINGKLLLSSIWEEKKRTAAETKWKEMYTNRKWQLDAAGEELFRHREEAQVHFRQLHLFLLVGCQKSRESGRKNENVERIKEGKGAPPLVLHFTQEEGKEKQQQQHFAPLPWRKIILTLSWKEEEKGGENLIPPY